MVHAIVEDSVIFLALAPASFAFVYRTLWAAVTLPPPCGQRSRRRRGGDGGAVVLADCVDGSRLNCNLDIIYQ